MVFLFYRISLLYCFLHCIYDNSYNINIRNTYEIRIIQICIFKIFVNKKIRSTKISYNHTYHRNKKRYGNQYFRSSFVPNWYLFNSHCIHQPSGCYSCHNNKVQRIRYQYSECIYRKNSRIYT